MVIVLPLIVAFPSGGSRNPKKMNKRTSTLSGLIRMFQRTQKLKPSIECWSWSYRVVVEP